MPMGQGVERTEPVAMEYAAEAPTAPMVSLRYGKWNTIRCALDPDQLFDLEADPHELTNLAECQPHQGTWPTARQIRTRWDLDRFDAEVRRPSAPLGCL